MQNNIRHVLDCLDKVREELVGLQQENQSLRNERDKLVIERNEGQKMYWPEEVIQNQVMLGEAARGLINTASQFINCLPAEQQSRFGHQIEKVKQMLLRVKQPRTKFNFPGFMNQMHLATLMGLNPMELPVNSSYSMGPVECKRGKVEEEGRSSVETRPSEEVVIQEERARGRPYEVDLAALGLVAQEVRTKNAMSYHIVNDHQPSPVQFEGVSGAPKSVRRVSTLLQKDVVCALAVTPSFHTAYTGGKGKICAWNISSLPNLASSPIASVECLNNSYVRSIKLGKNARTLVVGGEDETVSIFDLGNGGIVKKADLKSGIAACYALSITNDDKLCYVCCSDGMVGVWDLHNASLVRQFRAHQEGATCIDLNDSLIWTGGLDNHVCTWDLRDDKLLTKYPFKSRIYSLAASPDWLAVGMENSTIECLNLQQNEKYQLLLHESCVLSIKFAHSHTWMASTGKDNMLNGWVTPHGHNIFQVRESASVLCSEISPNDDFIIAGCGDNKATIFEISY